MLSHHYLLTEFLCQSFSCAVVELELAIQEAFNAACLEDRAGAFVEGLRGIDGVTAALAG